MSHLNRPQYVGKEQIMNGFETLSKQGDLVFAMWASNRDIIFQCCGNYEMQKEILQSNLDSLTETGCTDLLLIKMYPAASVNGFIDTTSKFRPVSITPVQICEYENIKAIGSEMTYRPQGLSPEAWNTFKDIAKLPDTIEAKINAAVDAKLKELLPEEEEEPEEAEDQVTKIVATINGLTQNPQIMSMIGQVVEFLTRRTPVIAPSRIGMVEPQTADQMQQQQPQTKQQIPYNEEVMNDALTRLSFHCDLGNDLAKLASLAESNPFVFNSMLDTLRKM